MSPFYRRIRTATHSFSLPFLWLLCLIIGWLGCPPSSTYSFPFPIVAAKGAKAPGPFRWSRSPLFLPSPRAFHTALSLDGMVFNIGGCQYHSVKLDTYCPSSYFVEVYDLRTGVWLRANISEIGADLVSFGSQFALVATSEVHSPVIYIAPAGSGRLLTTNPSGDVIHSLLSYYALSWPTATLQNSSTAMLKECDFRMNTARFSASWFSFGDYLYIVGGLDATTRAPVLSFEQHAMCCDSLGDCPEHADVLFYKGFFAADIVMIANTSITTPMTFGSLGTVLATGEVHVLIASASVSSCRDMFPVGTLVVFRSVRLLFNLGDVMVLSVLRCDESIIAKVVLPDGTTTTAAPTTAAPAPPTSAPLQTPTLIQTPNRLAAAVSSLQQVAPLPQTSTLHTAVNCTAASRCSLRGGVGPSLATMTASVDGVAAQLLASSGQHGAGGFVAPSMGADAHSGGRPIDAQPFHIVLRKTRLQQENRTLLTSSSRARRGGGPVPAAPLVLPPRPLSSTSLGGDATSFLPEAIGSGHDTITVRFHTATGRFVAVDLPSGADGRSDRADGKDPYLPRQLLEDLGLLVELVPARGAGGGPPALSSGTSSNDTFTIGPNAVVVYDMFIIPVNRTMVLVCGFFGGCESVLVATDILNGAAFIVIDGNAWQMGGVYWRDFYPSMVAGLLLDVAPSASLFAPPMMDYVSTNNELLTWACNPESQLCTNALGLVTAFADAGCVFTLDHIISTAGDNKGFTYMNVSAAKVPVLMYFGVSKPACNVPPSLNATYCLRKQSLDPTLCVLRDMCPFTDVDGSTYCCVRNPAALPQLQVVQLLTSQNIEVIPFVPPNPVIPGENWFYVHAAYITVIVYACCSALLLCGGLLFLRYYTISRGLAGSWLLRKPLLQGSSSDDDDTRTGNTVVGRTVKGGAPRRNGKGQGRRDYIDDDVLETGSVAVSLRTNKAGGVGNGSEGGSSRGSHRRRQHAQFDASSSASSHGSEDAPRGRSRGSSAASAPPPLGTFATIQQHRGGGGAASSSARRPHHHEGERGSGRGALSNSSRAHRSDYSSDGSGLGDSSGRSVGGGDGPSAGTYSKITVTNTDDGRRAKAYLAVDSHTNSSRGRGGKGGASEAVGGKPPRDRRRSSGDVSHSNASSSNATNATHNRGASTVVHAVGGATSSGPHTLGIAGSGTMTSSGTAGAHKAAAEKQRRGDRKGAAGGRSSRRGGGGGSDAFSNASQTTRDSNRSSILLGGGSTSTPHLLAAPHPSHQPPHRTSSRASLKKQPIYLADYRVVDVIGEGAYGVVLKGIRRHDKQAVAIKFMVCQSDSDRQKAMQEYRTVKKFQGHPHIVQISDLFINWEEEDYAGFEASGSSSHHPPLPSSSSRRSGTSGASDVLASRSEDLSGSMGADELKIVLQSPRFVCIVLEYFPAGDLRRLLQLYPEPIVPEGVAIKVLSQVANALSALHSQVPPIAHRDLKPDNILVDARLNRVLLTDFGLAAEVTEGRLFTRAGTPLYLAPETVAGKGGKEADLWALGCIAYALATRRVGHENARVLFRELREQGVAEAMRAEMRHYSNEYADLTLALLSFEPLMRPPAMSVAALCTRMLADIEGVAGPSSDASSGASSDDSMGDDAFGDGPHGSRRRQRNPVSIVPQRQMEALVRGGFIVPPPK